MDAGCMGGSQTDSTGLCVLRKPPLGLWGRLGLLSASVTHSPTEEAPVCRRTPRTTPFHGGGTGQVAWSLSVLGLGQASVLVN